MGKLVVVGDAAQSVYSFAGAMSDSLDQISNKFNCKTLPLNYSFRCAKVIAKEAQQYVPVFEALPNAPEGIVDHVEFKEIDINNIQVNDMVLCRNNAPLVSFAYKLLRASIPCKVLGRDICAGLIALATRWKRIKTCKSLYVKLEEYRDREIKKLQAKKKEDLIPSVTDRVESLFVFIEMVGIDAKVDQLVAKITSLFGDEEDMKDVVLLSSIHKSKGLEAEHVWLLGNNIYVPSPYARTEEAIQQERNLAYVSITRAKTHLTYVNMKKGDL